MVDAKLDKEKALTLKEIFYKFENVCFDKVTIHTDKAPNKTGLTYYSQNWWVMIDGWGSFIRTHGDLYLALKDKPARYEMNLDKGEIHIYMIEEE